jgi:hypothetical protein
MWKVYLFEFIIVVLVSLLWVNILSNHKDENKKEK